MAMQVHTCVRPPPLEMRAFIGFDPESVIPQFQDFMRLIVMPCREHMSVLIRENLVGEHDRRIE